MSQCASFFPPGAKWGLACVIQLSSHLKAFCLLIMFLLECWKTVHFFVWYLMLILACFCLDQKNMMIPFPCVCVYTSGGQSWHQVLFPITSPPLYFEASFLTEPRTHPFYFSAGQQVQSSPASPFPAERFTQVCWHTQLLHGCWRLHSGPYIYAYIMHFTNLGVFPRHPPLSFLNVNNQGKNILYNKDKIKP